MSPKNPNPSSQPHRPATQQRFSIKCFRPFIISLSLTLVLVWYGMKCLPSGPPSANKNIFRLLPTEMPVRPVPPSFNKQPPRTQTTLVWAMSGWKLSATKKRQQQLQGMLLFSPFFLFILKSYTPKTPFSFFGHKNTWEGGVFTEKSEIHIKIFKK